MADNRPRGREKRVTSGGSGVHRRGSGLGTGPVGNSSGYSGRGSGGSGGSGGGGGFGGSGGSGFGGSGGRRFGNRAPSGGGSPLGIIIVIIIAILGGGGGLGSLLFGGGGGSSTGTGTTSSHSLSTESLSSNSLGSLGSFDVSSLFGSAQTAASVLGNSTGWHFSNASSAGNTGSLDDSVVSGARDKFTKIRGNGKDTVTVMVYLCGTDLESRSGMATSDLSEMAAAKLSDNVNVLVYTGGCKSWRNRIVDSGTNQIYQIKGGGLQKLVANDGKRAMTDPDTLTHFIEWCNENYPADRKELIFWDHGGGSITGFGYDETLTRNDSMDLTEIASALENSGTYFDIIGFDACLMATAENALALSQYGDYLLASEETEPGKGWYYTNWLNELSKNTSMPTTQLGKKIIDDFIDVSAQQCPGQLTTLSLVDLAELSATLPEKFVSFSETTSDLLMNKEYDTVSTARSNSREFATTSKIDQVDLADFCLNLGTNEGQELADAVLSAVKYNRACKGMTNAYGLSIFFPKKKLSRVDDMVRTYKSLGIDSSYSKCIQQYAVVSATGQAVSSGYSNSASPFGALGGSSISYNLGSGGAPSSSSGNVYSVIGTELMNQLINSMLSGDAASFGIPGLDRSNSNFLSDSGISAEQMEGILAKSQFSADALTWSQDEEGIHTLSLPEEQWSLVRKLDMNVFYDDGEGYVDLGLDNVIEFTDDGKLIGDMDRTWLSINEQPVAYYHLDTVDDGDEYTITGRVPAYLKHADSDEAERVNLLLVFDNDNPYGYVMGYRTDYREGETDALAKADTFRPGDQIDYICDFYGYDGSYLDSYYLGNPVTISSDELQFSDETDEISLDDAGASAGGTWHPMISNTDVGEGAVMVSYRFTDLYGQEYWTTPIIE